MVGVVVRAGVCVGIAVAIWLTGGTAHAGDSGAAFNWSGFYLGVTGGGGTGAYDAQTSTTAGSYLNARRSALVTSVGNQGIRAAGPLAGAEAGYNWRTGNLLLGLEADLQAIQLSASTNSGAVPYPTGPNSFTVTSFGDSDWLFTARPRLGYIAPNNWLFYATGGLAVTRLDGNFTFVDTNFAEEAANIQKYRAGYAFGGGIEAPLTGRWSIKADYLHVSFPHTGANVVSNDLAAQDFTHVLNLKADIFRAGLNYHFGDPADPAKPSPLLSKVPAMAAADPAFSQWTLQTGARLWLSSGTLGAPQSLFNYPSPLTLTSRLVYKDLDGVSGETFARADHSSGFFVKGYVGAGQITGGTLIDEDFPGFGGAYSNTQSPTYGSFGYATVDVGYALLRTPTVKLGPFVGYNYYNQHINGIGCNQIAGDTTCGGIDPQMQVFSEDDHFNSLRVGVSTEAMLTDRVKLTTDAAYIPLTDFGGEDQHLLRQLLLWEGANSGSGVMLEAALDYYLTPSWSVGIGGRYWAWNTNNGSWLFDNLPPGSGPQFYEPAIFSNERYGVFVQTSYRWGAETDRAQRASVQANAVAAPMNWTGMFVGGHFGGGWSASDWSDPFGSTPAAGLTNVAGFGDHPRATGALIGGQIGADWQRGVWVLGVEAAASAANFKGANTCFSGLDGINCQAVVNAVGTATGRIGYAVDRALPFVRAGGAWTNTTYGLYGFNNEPLSLGTGNTPQNRFGWTIGGGVEYALTDAWTALAEYDHLEFGSETVPFPTVATVNAATIGVKQSIDMFKFGVNYRFMPASLFAAR